MQAVAWGEFLAKLTGLIFIIIAIFLKLNIYFILLNVVLGGLVRFSILFFKAKKYIQFKWQFDFDLWKKVLNKTWPLALSIVFSMMYFLMDTIILSWTQPNFDVGIYGASYKVLENLIVFPVMFIGLVFPLLSQSWQNQDLEKFKHVLQKAFDFLIIIVTPLIFGGYLIGNKLMVFVAGSEFYLSGEVLKILLLAVGWLFVGQLFGHTIIALDLQKKMMWCYLIIAIMSLIGYSILIPRYSYFGAAWMTVGAEMLMVILSSLLIFKKTHWLPEIKTLFKSLFASLIMAGAIYLILDLNLLINLIIGIIVYFSILYLIGGVKKQVLQEILRLKYNTNDTN
jgi:O-antigen/teichoic acid export membrane protein